MSADRTVGGRVLVLTRDPELVKRQLAGEAPPSPLHAELADGVSTDEMAPGWASYYFDERLARYALVGFRGGVIAEGDMVGGGFRVLVGGESFGTGSSRETAPYAQLLAGIELVVAKSFGRIYRQNSENIGLLTSTDFSLLDGLLRGERIGVEELFASGDEPSREVMRVGVRADLRFSHEYVTPMADALFRGAFGSEARVADPERVLLFRDHLNLASPPVVAESALRGELSLPALFTGSAA
jgi:hypothetical protein